MVCVIQCVVTLSWVALLEGNWTGSCGWPPISHCDSCPWLLFWSFTPLGSDALWRMPSSRPYLHFSPVALDVIGLKIACDVATNRAPAAISAPGLSLLQWKACSGLPLQTVYCRKRKRKTNSNQLLNPF